MLLTVTSVLITGPLVIPLSGGGSLRLAPGQTSDPLPEAEVAGSPAIEKLAARGAIAVRPAAQPGRRAGAKPRDDVKS